MDDATSGPRAANGGAGYWQHNGLNTEKQHPGRSEPDGPVPGLLGSLASIPNAPNRALATGRQAAGRQAIAFKIGMFVSEGGSEFTFMVFILAQSTACPIVRNDL
ncbi:hypothetical protein ACMHYJ_00815 [Castellaniella hirudinis]|uniref:hypothetical protein n=1 Tax=Castellaniella hirudinis TaxID=1144617 RepID=UPI0039C11C18